ncbi:Bifunctional protein PutA [Marinobacterium sp. xm-a-121]|uniref:bifunctional proline dehydrogenase/L-glutamate gamma-semialdehyde dehydrogenase PutA n=1 Tax=unclassified Marinobacterium TaxID=2644139 RepID=UPI001568E2BB|nr:MULTISPECIES: bifunctional proline dehydrogenase/L-glutamate gamma-semialdehyde dehydrogenase PutA [unclassified Marinobacterium]NRP38737.1 Bifunctional protein PutA [Marinobacterium sp. xm-a-121]NRP52268.1 Bifunctional protein PutA [Marinobacterium sp. xm-v-242]NRP60433.1 Bifunctional protein PutA [Marinobacterium sp. xm-d-564]NRP76849.1 Bifunctional protein PutA [Marinobacterium sp. xm-m-383]NRP95793.1 Bifunctional protein PutA [Marinobacterium sp. xm-g-59]
MNAQNTHIQIPYCDQSELDQLQQLIEKEQLLQWVTPDLQTVASNLVTAIRNNFKPSILEQFLRAYPLDTQEGLSLMTLAEAYQRVPDKQTANELIIDKLANRDWSVKTAQTSALVRGASMGLQLGSASLKMKPLRSAILAAMRIGVGAGMRLMGRAFVLGESIKSAQERAGKLEFQGYTFSYDMLGEAAYTQADADRYFNSYRNALLALIEQSKSTQIEKNPGISVKLSALHPRYELFNEDEAVTQLSERMLSLCSLAKEHNIGLNIDAEECARLEISLDIIRNLIEAPELSGWDGLGIVVQAYNRKAYSVLDQLYAWADQSNRKLMVRLVKGAYWDTEIKLAQEQGLDHFPVFTAKHHTDVSYLACARKLVRYGDRIYPQFATHNAQTAACVLNWAKEAGIAFEMQRLHGMGEALHQELLEKHQTGCRIYAPVGTHKDLLAYLVRRLLENGANSSFVSQLADEAIPPQQVVASPVHQKLIEQAVTPGSAIFTDRSNSRGFDLGEQAEVDALLASRSLFMQTIWGETGDVPVVEPYSQELLGHYQTTDLSSVDQLFNQAKVAQTAWADKPLKGKLLRQIADLYERDTPELLALLAREAGKTLADAINEIREAVDFLRYYADESDGLDQQTEARGVAVCISPWNFPLAIFTGQIAASVGAGNAVLAKPAEQTSLVARKAIELWKEAGMPTDLVQLVFGTGAQQGNALVSHPDVNAVIFTGSTATAKRIEKALAHNAAPDTLLVAETGGLNAMIADASALPEQVVKAVMASAFQSAGQRCSALRMLYVQREVYPQILEMITGAMALLKVGDPSELKCDVGPVIDATAAQALNTYIEEQRSRIVYQTKTQELDGHFVTPTLLEVDGIHDLDFERFGPILHIAPYNADQLDDVVNDINARGYGLTFAMHSRIQNRTERLCAELNVGNCYINRNQIGAIVESQPFGGEGMSGTGPKAGGPNYLVNLTQPETIESQYQPNPLDLLSAEQVQSAWQTLRSQFKPLARELLTQCPSVTGEDNQLFTSARGYWLVAGDEQAWQQAIASASTGNPTLLLTKKIPDSDIMKDLPIICLAGDLDPGLLTELADLAGVSVSAHEALCKQIRITLSQREGAIIPLLKSKGHSVYHRKEQHICEDTTASGGNAALLMS